MTADEARQLPVGLYRLYWHNNAGTSLAAVGQDREGDVWYAPANWVTVPWNDWSKVARAELIQESFPHRPDAEALGGDVEIDMAEVQAKLERFRAGDVRLVGGLYSPGSPWALDVPQVHEEKPKDAVADVPLPVVPSGWEAAWAKVDELMSKPPPPPAGIQEARLREMIEGLESRRIPYRVTDHPPTYDPPKDGNQSGWAHFCGLGKYLLYGPWAETYTDMRPYTAGPDAEAAAKRVGAAIDKALVGTAAEPCSQCPATLQGFRCIFPQGHVNPHVYEQPIADAESWRDRPPLL